jgi:hypothetical protein
VGAANGGKLRPGETAPGDFETAIRLAADAPLDGYIEECYRLNLDPPARAG